MLKFCKIFILISCLCFSEDLHFFKIVNVYDGDTFKVNIDNVPDVFGKEISIRIKGIDCPEIKSHDAYEKEIAYKAKVMTEAHLKAAKKIELKNVERDKYFRVLADVYVDGVLLADELLKCGLARTYFGEKKLPWIKKTKKLNCVQKCPI